MDLLSIILIVGALAVGFGGHFYISRLIGGKQISTAEDEAKRIREDAETKAQTLIKEADLQAKDTIFQAKVELDKEAQERRSEFQNVETRLAQKEETLGRKDETLSSREKETVTLERRLNEQERNIAAQEEKYREMLDGCRAELEHISQMTADQARNQLMEDLVSEAKHEAAKKIKHIEDEARVNAEANAKKITGMAIQRYAGEYVAERTVAVVHLPSDDMKGRIIGREGRNIRALEAATGMDLIVDDTPEAVVISGFNPIRREVAKIALERLVADGRIHPARIEEVVKKAEKEVSKSIAEAGQNAMFELGIHGVHAEVLKLVGMLRYRTSYTQNQWQHALEVGFINGIMAAELGLNVKEARRAGVLHDIGKAVSHEVEGPHVTIGAELAKRHGEKQIIVGAIAGHHDNEPSTLLAMLTQAADALSGARPGARRETLETYVSRVNDLEKIADAFGGVERSYAIQAGREVRIIVESEKVSDADAVVLSQDIARKIEKELTYPGQIKVMVLRESRSVDYAK